MSISELIKSELPGTTFTIEGTSRGAEMRDGQISERPEKTVNDWELLVGVKIAADNRQPYPVPASTQNQLKDLLDSAGATSAQPKPSAVKMG